MLYNELSDLERRAYELILKHGKKGIYQNDLWKVMGINSREASRVVGKLLKKGLIVRKPAVNRGRKTYLITPAPPKKPTRARRRIELTFLTKVDIRPFLDIPCVRCPFIDKCYVGGFYDPIKCPWLEKWLYTQLYRKKG